MELYRQIPVSLDETFQVAPMEGHAAQRSRCFVGPSPTCRRWINPHGSLNRTAISGFRIFGRQHDTQSTNRVVLLPEIGFFSPRAGLMMGDKVMLYIAATGRPTGQPAFANSHGLDSTGLRRGALVVLLNIDVGRLSDRRCKEVVAVVRVALPNCGRNCLVVPALTPRKLWTRQC